MLAITPGEPAGVGPELVIALAQSARSVKWVAIADPDMLRERARLLAMPLKIRSTPTGRAGELQVEPVPLAHKAVPGCLNVANAPAVLESLGVAVEGCLSGRFAGLVTGPVQKSVINDAGIAFSGHTEFLRDLSDAGDVLMLLVAGSLRVALATTHLPLRDVPDALTADLLRSKLGLLLNGLRDRFGIAEPRVLVTGLNPHAGEAGHLGREEIDVIGPVCEQFRAFGAAVVGPMSADAAFAGGGSGFMDPVLHRVADDRAVAAENQAIGAGARAMLAPTVGGEDDASSASGRAVQADAVLAMYHDQGLPVLKYARFGTAVNVTLGLPFVRTSVDHGTALDIAGTGTADTGSLAAAVALAEELGRRPRTPHGLAG